MALVEEQSLAQEIMQAKADYAAAQAVGDQAGMDAAHARAQAARDRLRSIGRGDIADGMDSNDTIDSAKAIYDAVTGGGGGNSSRAPTAGGTPKQDDPLYQTQSDGGYTTSGPKTVKNGGGGSGGNAPSNNPTDLAGKVTKGVTDFLSSLLGNVNTGVQAGAKGTGAAAGGLAQTVATVGGTVVKVILPIAVIWGAVKVFRIALKVGR